MSTPLNMHGARMALNRDPELRQWVEQWLKNKERTLTATMTDEEFEKHCLQSPGRELGRDAKLTASDGVPQDHFGWSIAVSGSTVVLGSPGDDMNQGSAYIFGP